MRRRLGQRGGAGIGGFTLIELMIVMLILSLLAALVLLLMNNSSKEAQKTATQSAVAQTQRAIDLYKYYTDELPDLVTSWEPLTRETTLPDGRTIGPFIDHPPVNQLVGENRSAVADGSDEVVYTDVSPFLYDYADGAGSGRFIAAYEPQP